MYVLPSFLVHQWKIANYAGWLYRKACMTKFKWILMPLHVNDCHWALLIANVSNKSVDIANSLSSYNTDELLERWRDYMATLAAVMKELDVF